MLHEPNRLSPEAIEIFKKMSVQAKIRVAGQLYETARKLKAAGLRMQHPNWPEERIQVTVREIFLYART